MRNALIHATLALLPMAALADTNPAPDAGLVPFDAHYSSRYGLLSATGERKLERSADGVWRFENHASALFASIPEDSTFTLRNGNVHSLTYHFKNPFNADRNMDVAFDWTKQQATDSEHNISVPINDQIYDKLSYQLQMQMDVCGDPEHFPGRNYTVVDLKRLKTYRVEFVDREDLKTRVGTLKTIHLRQFRPDKRDGKDTQIWLATDYHCVLVRLDQYSGDDIISLKLTHAKVNGVEVKGK